MRIMHHALGRFVFGLGMLLATSTFAQVPLGSSPSPVATGAGSLPVQIDSQAHFVIWADVDRVSFDEFLKWANQTELGPLLQGIQDPEKVAPAKSLLEKLHAAGAKRVYFAGQSTALMGDLGAMGMIIRCDQPERCAAALEANPLLPAQFLKATDGAVLLAMSEAGLSDLAEVEGTPSAQLSAALEPNEDAVGIAAAFPATVISLFVQSAPKDDSPQAAALRCLIHLEWARASGSPPDSRLKLEAKFDDPETATEFASQANSGVMSMFGDGEKTELVVADREYVTLSKLSGKPIAEIGKASREAAIRLENANKLRQIVLASLSFESTHNALPPQSLTDPAGKRLLSWRVLILPYLGEEELYKQFHLDEAWDSPHNLALLEKMPNVYRSKTSNKEQELKPGQTRIVAPLTANSIMGKGGGPTRLRDITDGTSNTILLVEAAPSAAVPWTKPADLVIDLTNPTVGLATEGQSTLLAAFADGSIRTLPSSIDPKTLKAYLSQDDGKVIEN